MDCDLARRLLPFARPGVADLDAADQIALGRHLESCPACAAAAAAEGAFDAALARAMREVPIPDTSSSRLTARLAAARRSFYRRLYLALGSILIILFAGWWGWSAWQRPVLDPLQLAQQTYEISGLSRTNDEAREAASDWLHLADGRLQAPDEFNYKLLAFAERSQFQGLANVPTLVFARNDATMRVYAVREGAFKGLGDIREEAGGCTVQTRRYDSMRGWVFIIVTSGAPPEAFRLPARSLDPA
jgi:hypothetical protein